MRTDSRSLALKITPGSIISNVLYWGVTKGSALLRHPSILNTEGVKEWI